MITDSELRISNESYTHKDFYQIYPEELDLVKELTNRWKPDESNESDPGVVLLKLLAFIADKENYNIDKNILEVFMPSCTQEDSMRKLCDMMGYDMHYYRSAETLVSFMWVKKYDSSSEEDTGGLRPTSEDAGERYILFPAFETVLTNDASDVTYVLTQDVILTHCNQVESGVAIEGTLCDFAINTDNIIRYYNLDDDLRLYLPETHIAENGIWIYNSSDTWKKNPWTKVSNLNTIDPDTKCWKFGYSSKKKLPYIQFPKDVAELIDEGLTLKYIRTTGVTGNVTARELSTLANSSSVKVNDGLSSVDIQIEEDGNKYLVIANASASVNGSDIETIDEAYNGFKKTIGTFDTLVTCRDYSNAIYNLMDDSYNPYVSNVVASDIRDDINYSNSVVTFDQYGCHSILIPERKTISKTVKGKDSSGVEHEITITETENKIDHFDLILYPLKPITTSYTSKTFQNSFKPSYENFTDIKNELSNYKTLSHNYKSLNTTENKDDIFCIKNKYRLEAKISTTYKVNGSEQKQILNNINTALYKNFNARKVDFGEEIPYDSVLKVIENADTRIKVVILEDFDVVPYIMTAEGKEYPLISESDVQSTGYYKKLVAKNVLAGKLPLFDYDKDFEYKYGEALVSDPVTGGVQSYPISYDDTPATKSITYLTTELNIPNSVLRTGYELKENESVQLIAPAYKSSIIYPAYTNYFAHIKQGAESNAQPCNLYHITYGETEEELNKAQFETLILTNTLYVRNTKASASNNPGYLVDDERYKYYKASQYTSGSQYYCLDDSLPGYNLVKHNIDTDVTLGVDNTAQLGVPADTEYKLEEGEWLAINYTDSDKNVFNILFEPDKKKTWKNSSPIPVEEDFTGVIKCNFDLVDSTKWAQSHSAVKKSGYYFGGNIDPIIAPIGMFQLGPSDQLEPRLLSQTVFGSAEKILKCYWYTNEQKGKLTFTLNEDGLYERILDSGEYFFYTDEAENSLATFGSGTIITIGVATNSSTSTGANIVWELPTEEEDSLDIDDVASNGIGAFNDVNWQRKNVDDTTHKLTLKNCTIISLGKEDKIKFEADEHDISTAWTTLDNPDKVLYNETNKLAGGVTWKIRAILDLNLGPNNIQHLVDENGVTQKIKCYTSKWTYTDDGHVIHIINPVNEDAMRSADKTWDDLTEVADSSTLTYTYHDVDLKANYLVQQKGGNMISVHRFKTDKTEMDDLKIIPFQEIKCEQHFLSSDTVPESVECLNTYNKVNLKGLDYLSLPVNLKENRFGIISFYYAPEEGDTADIHICVYPGGDLDSGSGASKSVNVIEYSDIDHWECLENHYIYNLKEGLNVLRIENASLVIIHPISTEGSKHSGTLTFTQMGVVKTVGDYQGTNMSGVDFELLGLKNTECNDFLRDYIFGYTDFFYNVPVSDSERIDVDSMKDINAWENINNVCNKFTISELDVDSFENIEIARSSKLS